MDDITLEGLKLTYDFVKHITTLDSALIIIIATLMETVFKSREISKRSLLGLCILFLVISFVGSIFFLGFVAYWLTYFQSPDWPVVPVTIGFWSSIIGFLIAFILLTIFTYVNYSNDLRITRHGNNNG